MNISIDPNAEPIAHISPYKRINLGRPSLKSVITLLEAIAAGGRMPDAETYQYDYLREAWILKDGK